jgi:hypothetical protein
MNNQLENINYNKAMAQHTILNSKNNENFKLMNKLKKKWFEKKLNETNKTNKNKIILNDFIKGIVPKDKIESFSKMDNQNKITSKKPIRNALKLFKRKKTHLMSGKIRNPNKNAYKNLIHSSKAKYKSNSGMINEMIKRKNSNYNKIIHGAAKSPIVNEYAHNILYNDMTISDLEKRKHYNYDKLLQIIGTSSIISDYIRNILNIENAIYKLKERKHSNYNKMLHKAANSPSISDVLKLVEINSKTFQNNDIVSNNYNNSINNIAKSSLGKNFINGFLSNDSSQIENKEQYYKKLIGNASNAYNFYTSNPTQTNGLFLKEQVSKLNPQQRIQFDSLFTPDSFNPPEYEPFEQTNENKY